MKELLLKYRELYTKKLEYERDINDIENALQDNFLDYMYKKELKDEQSYDNRMIHEIDDKLRAIRMELAKQGLTIEQLEKEESNQK